MLFRKALISMILLSLAVTSCLPKSFPGLGEKNSSLPTDNQEGEPPTLDFIIPKPVSVLPANGFFELNPATKIIFPAGDTALQAIGDFLAARLRPATGYALPVVAGGNEQGNIALTLLNDAELGEEGYQLTITPHVVILAAAKPAGIFYGAQTFRQLLPARIEGEGEQAGSVQEAAWQVAAGVIRDFPRYAWRGFMLDVSRHFFGVEDIKRYIDLIAYYKMNRLHLHLSDDQGWRIEIKSWPLLARHGGTLQVGGGAGGYYTQEQYADIVAYAQRQFVMIIPEIEMPGHINAALASYADLNCSGSAQQLYTETKVGFSSLCIDKEITYRFIRDVLSEVAALTPGPYLHIGGDEAHSTPKDEYIRFIERAQEIVQALDKQMIGWEEIAQARILPTTIAQHWHDETAHQAVHQGAKVILSPGTRIYLDMKYDPETQLGLSWAGYIDLPTAYNWDPAAQVPGVGEADILGVEAPLWSETLETPQDVDFMAFPRLPGVAEIGWTPQVGREWEEYRLRLAAHGLRLEKMGVNYYRSPQVDWR